MAGLLAVFLLVSSAFARPECGGILCAFRENNGNPTDCSFVNIAQPQGTITRALPFSGCTDRGTQSNGVPQSAFAWSGGYLYWMSGTGASVWQVDDSLGTVTNYGPLPSAYNYTVGLESVSGAGLFLLTTSTLYYSSQMTSPPGPFTPILWGLTLSQKAVITGDYFNPYFYLVDGSMLWVIDVTNPMSPVVTPVKMATLNHILDIQLYVAGGDPTTQVLLALQDSSLYWLNFHTGNSTFIMNIPPTASLPWPNAISGETWFVSDNATLWTIDPVMAEVLTSSPFDGADLQSTFQYHP